jgi:hypothetical protein
MPFTATDVLTAALVIITAYYAWQTRVLARLTKETIDASQLAEEARSRPYVHVTNVKGIPRASREPPDHFDLDLTVEFKNMGHGAAINVTGTIEHGQIPLVQSSGPANLSGDGGVGTLVFSASTVSALPFYGSLPQDFRLALAYRDLVARDWRSATTIRANTPLAPTTGPPVAFEVVDENESIELTGLTVPRVVTRVRGAARR